RRSSPVRSWWSLWRGGAPRVVVLGRTGTRGDGGIHAERAAILAAPRRCGTEGGVVCIYGGVALLTRERRRRRANPYAGRLSREHALMRDTICRMDRHRGRLRRRRAPGHSSLARRGGDRVEKVLLRGWAVAERRAWSVA